MYPVSSVKEGNKKGGKCKISRVLQSSVTCTQASPNVEASNRPKQAQHLPTCRKVQNGNTRVHQGHSNSRGMGVVDRPIRRLPSHPHPPKLKEIPKVLPQVANVSVHFSSLRTSHGPSGLYNDCQRGEADGPVKLSRKIRLHQYLDNWLIRAQSQEEAQVNTQTVADLTHSLGWINQEKSELKPTQVFLFVGYEYHQDSALVKPTQERWLKLQDLILRLQSKHVLTARCLMSLIGLLASMEKSFQALEISSVVGQPHSLERSHFSTPRMVAESCKHDERCRPSSQRPPYPTLYRLLKRRLGRSLRANLYTRSVVRQGKRATHKCYRAEGGFSGPSKVQEPVPKPNSVGRYRQLNSSILHKQTRRNPLGGDVCSPVEPDTSQDD